MNRTITSALILLLAFASVHVAANRVQDDASIAAFWTEFKAAVAAGNKNRVAALTQFPVDMPYAVRRIPNKAQLLRRYREVFNGEANAAKCFPNANPAKESGRPREFTVACDNGSGQEVVIYRFVRTGRGWRFKGLDNINE